MDRAEAEAIYDSGRKTCVKVLLALANQVERLEGRVERLEEEIRELRRDSDNSSLPPSADPGAWKRRRQGKRSERKPGGQPASPGRVGGSCRSSRSTRSSSISPSNAARAVTRSPVGRRRDERAATRSRSCRRSRSGSRSTGSLGVAA